MSLSGWQILAGRLFQSRSPVQWLQSSGRRTVCWSVGHNTCRCRLIVSWETSWQSSTRYAAVESWSTLSTRRANLKSTRCRTGSQWSCLNTGMIWSHQRVPVTSRAAAFWTDWSCLSRVSVIPLNRELQNWREWGLGIAAAEILMQVLFHSCQPTNSLEVLTEISNCWVDLISCIRYGSRWIV